jgi:hypothetical protein
MKTDRVANFHCVDTVTIISGGIKYYNVGKFAPPLVTHTYDVIRNRRIVKSIADVEASQRGLSHIRLNLSKPLSVISPSPIKGERAFNINRCNLADYSIKSANKTIGDSKMNCVTFSKNSTEKLAWRHCTY